MGMNPLQEAIVRSISAFCCCPYNPQAQFYVHGMGMNPSERRARLGMAVVMEAAVLLALVAEYRKCVQIGWCLRTVGSFAYSLLSHASLWRRSCWRSPPSTASEAVFHPAVFLRVHCLHLPAAAVIIVSQCPPLRPSTGSRYH